MATSLTRQLEKLKTPQTQILLPSNKSASILFDAREAANTTIDAAFDLGLDGLKELEKIDPKFAEFEQLLFSDSAKNLQRAVQTADVNKKLGEHLKKFLLMLSPHILIKPALQTLEWLVRRFCIGEYNPEEMILTALPYHGTRTFILIIRVVPSIAQTQSPWNWLQPAVDTGTPLDTITVHKIFGKNPALLRRLCDFTINAYKSCPKGDAGKLHTLFTFTCATVLGVLCREESVTQAILACVIPLIRTGLASPTSSLLSGCMSIIAHLFARVPLAQRVSHEIILQLLSLKVPSLQNDAASLLLLYFSAQPRLGNTVDMPKSALTRISNLSWLPEAINKLTYTEEDKSIDVLPLMMPLLEMLLEEVLTFPDPKSVDACELFTSFIDVVSLQPVQAPKVISFVFNNLPSKNTDNELLIWFRKTCALLEIKHPEVYDAEACRILTNNTNQARKLKKILGLQTISVDDDSGLMITPRGLVMKLLHPEEAIRSAAVTCLGEAFPTLLENDRKWVAAALKDRLNDDSMNVIFAVLQLPYLSDILEGDSEVLTETLLNLLDSTPRDTWDIKALELTLKHLCNSTQEEEGEMRQMCILIAILPLIILYPSVFAIVIDSPFASQCEAFQIIRKKLQENCDNEDEPSGTWLLWGAQEALGCSPPEAIQLVEWRLKDQRPMHSLELVLLCRILCGAVPQVTIPDAIKCCQLVMAIRSRGDKLCVPQPHTKSTNKAKIAEEAYKTVVVQNVLPYEAIVAVLQSLATLSLGSKRGGPKVDILRWCDLFQADDFDEDKLKLCSMLFSILLELCCTNSDNVAFRNILKAMFQENFPTIEQRLHFLSYIWGSTDIKTHDLIRALNFGAALIKLHINQVGCRIIKLDSQATFIPSLILLLAHPEVEVRKGVLSVFRELIMCDAKSSDDTYYCMILALLARDAELLQDQKQLSVVLYSILSPDPAIQKLFLLSNKPSILSVGRCLMEHCASEFTPPHISVGLLEAFKYVQSEDILLQLAPLGCRILNDEWPNNAMDNVHWQIMSLILERLQDESSATTFKHDGAWELLKSALNNSLHFDENVISGYALRSISKDMFANLNSSEQAKFLSLVLDIPEPIGQSREIVSMLRRVTLDGSIIDKQLRICMIPVPIPQRRKSMGPVQSVSPVVVAENWKKGLLLLEALQDKKKIPNGDKITPALFQILRNCIDGSEQEYAKQLILGCMSTCLKPSNRSTENEEDASNISVAVDVELLVQCLRGTNNPQTQHQALLILAQTAHTVPEGLLHHLVSVFTFMGSLVMRHDDSYSFHVIAEVIDKLVPVIVKAQASSGADVSVLRVFVDAMPDIPSHRRAPIFKHLMDVLGWQRLWLFIALVGETSAPACQDDLNKSILTQKQRKNPKIHCALELGNTCPLSALLAACTDVLNYLSVLAAIKFNEQKQILNANQVKESLRKCGAENLHDPTARPSSETKRLQASCLSVLIDLLAARQNLEDDSEEEMNVELENVYRTLMECLMSYLGILTRQEKSSKNQGQSKFWPAMLHHAYSLLNKVNLLLPTRQFLAVVRGVLEKGQEDEVRAKALEVLGARLQLRAAAQLAPEEQSELLALAPGLKTLAVEGGLAADKALFCLRILARQMAATNPHTFGPVLASLVGLLENDKVTVTLQAGALLCVAELCATLKASALPSLPRIVPLVLKCAESHGVTSSDSNELVLIGAASAIQRLVETLPNFLSPFLSHILKVLSLLSSSLPSHVSTKAAAVLQPRLAAIRSGTSRISLRILLPAVSNVMSELRNDISTLPALGPLLNILATSFTEIERVQVDAHISELTTFFISALELRSDWDNKDNTEEVLQVVSQAEDCVIGALVALVMKLPESVFRPLYFQLSTWSSQAEQTLALRCRCITYYRCSTSLASSLKGLFVLFAFYFLKQAANLLKRCHSKSDEESIFGDTENSEQQCCVLLESMLETLLTVCIHDKQNFVNKECFDALMQPLVDQLENMIGGEDQLKARCSKLVGPCLAQFARATADDVLWKQLHYQILLKTRHTNATVRLVAVGAVKCLAGALGEELLPLLPEAVPFMAELLEDEDAEVEAACQDTVRDLEKILGEPLHKYF